MRRKDREITDPDRMLGILEACDCCRIGLVDDDGYAYVVPLNFGYSAKDGALTLYFHCAGEGKKLELLKKQGRASFQADCAHSLADGRLACDYSYYYASVAGRGKISFAADDGEKRRGLERLMAHYAPSAPTRFSDKHIAAVTVFSLEVTEWTCKVHGR